MAEPGGDEPLHHGEDEAHPGAGRRREQVLRRSVQDRWIAGVAGGIGRYLGVDANLVRIAFVVLTVAGGWGILIYLVAWLLMPQERPGDRVGPRPEGRSEGLWLFLGVGLIALGSVLLIDQLVPWFDRIVGPIVLIGVGVAVLLHGTRRQRPDGS